MKFIYLSILLILFIPQKKLHAQTDTLVAFFDHDFNESEADASTYVEVATKNIKTDSLWQTAIVNVKTKYPILKGFYKDTLLSVEQGKFEYFNDYGVKAREGNYVNSKKEGLWLMWDDNARLIDSSIYVDDSAITATSYQYSIYNTITQRSYFNTITHAKETLQYSSEDGHLTYEVHYVNGNDYKHEKIYYENGKLRADVSTEKTKTTNANYYDTSENEISKKEYLKLIATIEKFALPEFPGGINGFMGFVTDAIKRNNLVPYDKNAISITITFYLNDKGEPYNINVYSSFDDINRAVLYAVQGMPRWKMHGLQSYGPVTRRLYYTIPHQ